MAEISQIKCPRCELYMPAGTRNCPRCSQDMAGTKVQIRPAYNYQKIQQQQAGPVEYQRKCRVCGKLWHSLKTREDLLQKQEKSNTCMSIAECGNPTAQLQATRNVEANQSEIARLKSCPDCHSTNYDERLIYHQK